MRHEHVYVHARRVDPTRTVSLRRVFERALIARFRLLKKLAREFLLQSIITNAPKDEIARFREWLDRMIAEQVLEVVEGTPMQMAADKHWMNLYITSAYQKGLQHAASQIRKGGGEVSDHWVDSAFLRPIHADRVGLIHTRAYNELKGVTDAMASRLSDILAQGIAEGVGPMVIARRIADQIDSIGINRARRIARTEVIRAHAEATLNTYEEAGIEGVTVQVEFTATMDNRVCPKCAELNGKIFTIKESRGVIPVHPNCRCAWLPVVDAKGVVLQ